MGARQAAAFGTFGADRLERKHVLQEVEGVTGGEEKLTDCQKVDFLTVRFFMPNLPIQNNYSTKRHEIQPRIFPEKLSCGYCQEVYHMTVAVTKKTSRPRGIIHKVCG